ncbi:uncharacterized protein LOC132310486 [Cornus florida]|uniref:uncharacterized protein LOC132310486 n=1 Tax=Cornus florida TaxID=4283 RepID=UPI00289C2793|nr:uncharacterized protein LOC132310486 [Cornus florida]
MEFHGLPPLKRFRLMQQGEARGHQDDTVTSSRLPAKKRKESRDLPPPSLSSTTAATTTYCLPAKKRVWALQPDLISDNPISPFDLNVEYKPSFDEPKSDSREANDVENVNHGIEIPEKSEEEEEDDGIECAICQSTDGDPSDPIVFCDGCDLMVHTTCYGYPLINGVPEGDWFCTQCLISQSNPKTGKPFSCCLCPVTGGAMKPTGDGRWAHVVCALFMPEAFFRDPEGREGIDCSKVPPTRWEQRCYVCESANGCVIDCSEPKCKMAFHVTCGLKEELCIEYKEGRSKEAIVAGFCKTHTELWKKQQHTGKFKIVARDEHKK